VDLGDQMMGMFFISFDLIHVLLSGNDEKKDGRIIYNTPHTHTQAHVFLSRLNALSRVRFNINTTFSVVRA
jgi:hypothetical protein